MRKLNILLDEKKKSVQYTWQSKVIKRNVFTLTVLNFSGTTTGLAVPIWVPFMGQTDLFENYSFLIGQSAKIPLKKQLHKNM